MAYWLTLMPLVGSGVLANPYAVGGGGGVCVLANLYVVGGEGGGGGVLANPYAVELFADNFYSFKTEIADAISSFE